MAQLQTRGRFTFILQYELCSLLKTLQWLYTVWVMLIVEDPTVTVYSMIYAQCWRPYSDCIQYELCSLLKTKLAYCWKQRKTPINNHNHHRNPRSRYWHFYQNIKSSWLGFLLCIMQLYTHSWKLTFCVRVSLVFTFA
jgi:hypothetical protein